jgi:hypothetical protein
VAVSGVTAGAKSLRAEPPGRHQGAAASPCPPGGSALGRIVYDGCEPGPIVTDVHPCTPSHGRLGEACRGRKWRSGGYDGKQGPAQVQPTRDQVERDCARRTGRCGQDVRRNDLGGKDRIGPGKGGKRWDEDARNRRGAPSRRR